MRRQRACRPVLAAAGRRRCFSRSSSRSVYILECCGRTPDAAAVIMDVPNVPPIRSMHIVRATIMMVCRRLRRPVPREARRAAKGWYVQLEEETRKAGGGAKAA
jgi:hypothetical protein